MNRMLIVMPVVMALQSGALIDMNDPKTLSILRAVYVVICVINYLAWTMTKNEVEKTKEAAGGNTPIWTKKAASPFAGMFGGGAAPAYEKTTYYDLESAKVAQQLQQAFMNPLLNFAISAYAGMHMPWILQLVMGPLNLFEDQTLRRHLLHRWGLNAKPRPYDEELTDPTAAASTQVTDATTTSGSAPAGKAGATEAEVACEEAVYRTWENTSEPSNVGIFEAMAAAGQPIVTFKTKNEGWTALMAVAGHALNGKAETRKMLTLGCDVNAQDNEGWTAVHWAAYHGAIGALEAICGAYSDKAASEKADKKGTAPEVSLGSIADLKALLNIEDKDGRKALDVAVQEGAKDVEALLTKHME